MGSLRCVRSAGFWVWVFHWVLDVEDLAADGAGALSDLGVGGVVQVRVGFGAVFDEEGEPDLVRIVGVLADPFEGEAEGGEGVEVFVEDFAPGGVVLDGVLDEHSELGGHGGW